MRNVKRTVKYEAEGFEDLDAALAWVVQTSDTKFENGAEYVNVQRISSADATQSELDWRLVWTATVMGEPNAPSPKLVALGPQPSLVSA